MIAADASSLIAYLSGERGHDVSLIERAIEVQSLRLPPPVITELRSRPRAAASVDYVLATTPILGIDVGFWERAGEARRAILSHGHKAALADTLIAQCCIDADVALITRDKDFRPFVAWCGLKLVP